MPIANEDVAVRSDRHTGRPVERVWSISGDSRLAKRQQNLSVRAELEDLLTFSVGALRVRDPQVPILIHVHAVRNHEHPRAEALYEFSRRIKFEDGRIRLSHAGIPAAPFCHPHVAVPIET